MPTNWWEQDEVVEQPKAPAKPAQTTGNWWEQDEVVAQPQAAKVAPQPSAAPKPQAPKAGLGSAIVQGISQLGAGANEAIIGTLGLPADVIYAIGKRLGYEGAPPFLSSQSLQKGLSAVIGEAPPEPKGGSVAREIGRQLGSSAALGLGGMGLARSASPVVSKIGQFLLPQTGGQVAFQVASDVGAGIGTSVGRSAGGGDSTVGAVVGGLLGGMAAPALVGGVPLALGATAQYRKNLEQLKQAGMPLSAPAALPEGSLGSNIYRGIGAIDVTGSTGRHTQKMLDAYTEAAQKAGASYAPKAELGERVEQAANNARKAIQQQANMEYEAIREAVPAGFRAAPARAQSTVQSLRNEFGFALDDAVSAGLRKIMDKVETLPSLTYDEARQLSSSLGKYLSGETLGGGQDVRVAGALRGALQQDLETSLSQVNPSLAGQLRAANQAYKQNLEDFGAMNRMVDKVSADATANKFLNAIKSKGGDVEKLLANLPESELPDVRGAILNRLGKTRSAGGDVSGADFDPLIFASEWRKLSAEAKNALFKDNPELRKQVDALANVGDLLSNYSKRAGTLRANIGSIGNILRSGTGIASLTALGVPPPVAAGLVGAGAVSAPIFNAQWFARGLGAAPVLAAPAAKNIPIQQGLLGLEELTQNANK